MSFVDLYVFPHWRAAHAELPEQLRPPSLLVITDPSDRPRIERVLRSRQFRYAWLWASFEHDESDFILNLRMANEDSKIIRPYHEGFLTPVQAAVRSLELLPAAEPFKHERWLRNFAGSIEVLG